jgi:hypothetical protein
VIASHATISRHSVSIHLGRRTGGFADAIEQVVLHDEDAGPGLAPHFSLADLDGDGDADLLTNRLVRNHANRGAERGQHVQVGVGTPGTNGIRPLLGAYGPFRVGEQVRVHLGGVVPGATGVLVANYAQQMPFDPSGASLARAIPLMLHSQIAFTATGNAGDPAGTGTWDFAYTVPTYVVGRTKCYWVDVTDPASPTGTTRSNRVYVAYGP